MLLTECICLYLLLYEQNHGIKQRFVENEPAHDKKNNYLPIEGSAKAQTRLDRCPV